MTRPFFIPLTCLQGFKTDERLAKEFGAGILYERAVIRRDFVKRSIHKNIPLDCRTSLE